MLPDWLSNPGPLNYESGALLIASTFVLAVYPNVLTVKILNIGTCMSEQTV